MTRLLRAAVLAVALIAPTAHARAQLPFIHFGVAGGATVPTGATKDAYDRGWHGELLATLHVPLIPVGLRADAVYHRLSASGASAGSAGDLEVYSGELSATWDVGLPLVPITPYLIAGAGYFRQRSGNAPAGSSENSLGWSGGLGVRVGLGGVGVGVGVGVGAFVEGRYLGITTSGGRRTLVPLTLGVTVR
ncbi:MAG: hypothetical protein ACR2OG_16800 [Gemmatimonadaceae bacterium]